MKLKCKLYCRDCDKETIHEWTSMTLSAGMDRYEFICKECGDDNVFRVDKGDLLNIQWL